MKIPPDIFMRLRQYYREYAETLDHAKLTYDGYYRARPRLNYLRDAIECARDDARRWLLMEDHGEYVEVLIIRDAQHSYEIHAEIEHQFKEWEAAQ